MSARRHYRFLVAAGFLLLGACAGHTFPSCASDEQRMIVDSLYFGTAQPGGSVTPQQWKQFVSRVVAPRFPKGLTWWEASGQWQSANGPVERETSYVMQLVHGDDAQSDTAIREITSRYKSEFRQEAVLRLRSRACASF